MASKESSTRLKIFSVVWMAATLMAQPFLLFFGVQPVFADSVSGHVVINEVSPSPSPGKSEWVELYNPTDTSVVIGNWRVNRSGSSTNFGGVIPAGTEISAHGFYTLQASSAVLLNGGGELFLRDGPSGATIDTAAYPTISNDSSYARIYDADSEFELRSEAETTKNASNGTPDVTAPTVRPNVEDNTWLRGVSTLSMQVDDLAPKTYDIRVLDENDDTVEVGGRALGVSENPAEGVSLEYTWDTREVEDATYKVQFSAQDEANHTTTVERTVRVDNTPPEITNVTPAYEEPLSGTHEFNFKVTEMWPRRVTMKLNNDNYVQQLAAGSNTPVVDGFDFSGVIDLNVTVDTTELPNGTNTLTVEAQDYAENQAEPVVVAFEVFNEPASSGPEKPAPPAEETPGGFQPPDNAKVPATISPLTVVVSNTDLFDAQAAPAPAIDDGDESSDTRHDNGGVLGAATNKDGGEAEKKVAVENTVNQGLAWYWWAVIVFGALLAWLFIAAVSRKLRGGKAA